MFKNVFFFLGSFVIMLSLVLPVQAHQKDKELEARVERLERMADNPVLMKLSRRLGEQQREIQDLNDRIDRLQYQLRKLSEQLDTRYKESDDRLSKLEKENGQSSAVIAPTGTSVEATQSDLNQSVPDKKIDPPPEASSKPQTVVPVEKAPETSVDAEIKTRAATNEEKNEYKAAFSLMKQSKYQGAIEGFKDFRQKHPQSSLASNASYWAGEAHIVLGQKESGLSAFEDVMTSYPGSAKAPAAMLRSADTLQEMEKTDQAKQLYNELIKKYPSNTMAERAKKRLEELK